MTARRIQQQQRSRWVCIALLVNSVAVGVGVGASSYNYERGHPRHRTNPSGTTTTPPPPLPPGGREYEYADPYQAYDYQQQQQQQQLYNNPAIAAATATAAADPRSDRQPQLQPSASQSHHHRENYTPIHYSFKKEASLSNRKTEVISQADELPITALPFDETMDRDNYNNYHEQVADVPTMASPRQDAITVYMSTRKGALAIRFSCAVVGYGIGGIVGKSLLSNAWFMGSITSASFLLLSLFRSSYGELVRALGLALILATQRFSSIRSNYPTWPHVKAVLRMQPRRPFPPADNPWTYVPDFRREDPDFSMLYTTLAMTVLGSTVGGCVPLLPTWLGGTLGAAVFGFGTTTRNAQGDVLRSMGARVVAVGSVVVDMNQELKLLSKTMVVAGKVLDKILILDRKHKIKDRIVTGATFLYEQLARAAKQVQNDMNDRGGNARRDVSGSSADTRSGRLDRRGRDEDRARYERTSNASGRPEDRGQDEDRAKEFGIRREAGTAFSQGQARAARGDDAGRGDSRSR